jgi:ABC-2 type transport system ATP-binding protein
VPELADFCNTVGIIERGEMLAFGPVNQIVRQIQPTRVVIVTVLGDSSEPRAVISEMPHVLSAQLVDTHHIHVEFSGGPEEQSEFLYSLIERKLRIVEFRELEANLEDVFMRLTTGAVQ